MRVLLSTYGSRGDVEPVVALAAGLRALGADAVVCAPADEEFIALAARAGVELAPAFMPVRAWVTEALSNPGVDIRTRAAQIVAAQFEAVSAAAEGCDLVVATGLFPSTAAAKSVAEHRGLPYVYGAYCPMFVPSEHHRPFAYPGHPQPQGADNRALWDFDIGVMNALFGEATNRHRAAVGLPGVENVRDHVFTDRPWLAADPVLSPWRPTDLRRVVHTGAWILPDDRPLPAELLTFLEAGSPPVYVGFGSMPMQAARDAAVAAIEAARAQGRRVLLSRGWAELAPADGRDDVFLVGDTNQQALFPRVAAVVHHGGAGTTTTAARAGAPQVVVPQIADQPYWASRVAAMGVGVAHGGPAPTSESLSAALATTLATETAERARAVAGTIRGDGATVAARMLRQMVGGEGFEPPTLSV
ncbi:MAG: glycosyltransferase family 1 protein [Caulobacter sp.]|nr:glycosyltransferase family 1 protein [Caulobacter sp.]